MTPDLQEPMIIDIGEFHQFDPRFRGRFITMTHQNFNEFIDKGFIEVKTRSLLKYIDVFTPGGGYIIATYQFLESKVVIRLPE